ncbi:excinuclease ABC subunit UvrC [Desulfatitalea alkaliphila]|uniref:UvrABC system protein C n=1 Tax=Desulfatitalea alkaliphila TaxID=2929485 RepID=A0AA41UK66_9BACT|nr:excinuclease ABC subunit UvrC [Desulfatitalea alkaliphila]MCJ8501989.1 excinuclease ABC subunit UvrC [Desulfatitalea alkaliphila]
MTTNPTPPTAIEHPSSRIDRLAREAAAVATTPGVYIMRDERGAIVYVGKARNLRKRLQSYFQKQRPHDPKTVLLLTKVAAFETTLTHTEKEALILESNLIKRHRPRFNVVLKDDKRYPSLRLDIDAPYPRLTVVRKLRSDGSLYFGPYASAGAVRQTIKFINKTFKLCKCRCESFKKRPRPCLNHQMGLCMGPCFQEVSPGEYQEVVKEVVAFLRGRTPALIRKIKKQMQAAAATQDYESAARLRDKMFALERTLEKQVSVSTDFKDRDVVGLLAADDFTVIALLRVRGGFLLGSRNFVFEEAVGAPEAQMGVFLRQYYASAGRMPREILVSRLPEEPDLVAETLQEIRGGRVVIAVPQRGDKEKLVQLALQNARQSAGEHRLQRDANTAMLQRLQQRLKLRRPPVRIECFDNSNLFGSQPVSAMVVFEGGRPRAEGYRRYIMGGSGKPDDYAHMAAVIRRRFDKADQGRPWPDLLLVDGGKGQLNVALAILAEMGLGAQFDVAGIAKKDPDAGEQQDKIYLPGRANPVTFGKDGDLLLFLQRVRDEAHRWAITFQRRRRETAALRSALDQVSGIGPKRKAQLLHHFGSLEAIAAASPEALQALPGITAEIAQAVQAMIRGTDK